MEVKVTEKAKGEFRIPVMDRTFARGRKISMSEDQFFDSATQWAIRAGYLEIITDAEGVPSKPRGEEFRLVSRNCLTLRCIGRSINPDEVFYVSKDKLDDGELKLVLDRGMVVKESDFQKKSVATVKSDTETEVDTEVKVEDKKVPNKIAAPNMHIHIPEAVKEDVKPKAISAGRTAMMLDLDGDGSDDEMSFVDNEQKAAKVNKSSKIATNNDEVI